jgi:branched-subunit amino acid aminotransferase/4-amino-4-deoxychorismate lyase
MQGVIGKVFVDGEPVEPEAATLSFLDIGMQRGYGCFEALRSYAGKPFRSAEHVARLEASADRLHLDLPPADAVASWVRAVSEAAGDCIVRVLVTGGIEPSRPGTSSRVFVAAEPLPDLPDALRILPLDAPWHPDGVASELTGAKTLSYGPNLAASLRAQRAGFDDALLIGRSGAVLEGPTYGVAWVVEGAVETPSLDLGILASITRNALVELCESNAIELRKGRYPLQRLLDAEEVMVLSTVKEIAPVSAVGDAPFASGPMTDSLAQAFRDLVARELATA